MWWLQFVCGRMLTYADVCGAAGRCGGFNSRPSYYSWKKGYQTAKKKYTVVERRSANPRTRAVAVLFLLVLSLVNPAFARLVVATPSESR